MATMTSVPGGDSSMFIGAAFQGGVAQPPGYPLITLIYKLIFYLPGDSVHLINFTSGIFNSLAAVFLFLLFKRILNCKYSAILLSLLFCFMPLVFRYGLVAEVFALNNLFVSAILYLTYEYSQRKNLKIAMVGAFVMGLGVSNHHTFILIALPSLFWLLARFSELRNIKTILALLSLGLLGLIPYLYLVLAPSSAGNISWGETNTWSGFWHHFFRNDFGTFRLTSSGKGGFLINVKEFILQLPIESFGLLIVLPMSWALIKLKKVPKKDFSIFILLSTLFYLAFFFVLANINLSNELFKEVFMRFWQVPLLLILILSAYGLQALNQKLPSFQKGLFFILLFIIFSRGALSFQDSNRRNLTIFEDYGKKMLTSLPKDAALFATGDLQVNVLRFLQAVRKARPDITILPIPLMDLKWYRKNHLKLTTKIELPPGTYSSSKKPGTYQLLDIAQLNPEKQFFMLQEASIVKKTPGADLSLLKYYNWVPFGFLFSLEAKRKITNPLEVIRNHTWAKGQFTPNDYRKLEDGSWENLVLETVFWNAERFHMIYHTRLLKDKASSSNHKQALANHIEALRKSFNRIPPEFLKNLGLIYYQLLGTRPGLRPKLISAWGEYFEGLQDKSSREALEIKKALDHFGGKKK